MKTEQELDEELERWKREDLEKELRKKLEKELRKKIDAERLIAEYGERKRWRQELKDSLKFLFWATVALVVLVVITPFMGGLSARMEISPDAGEVSWFGVLMVGGVLYVKVVYDLVTHLMKRRR